MTTVDTSPDMQVISDILQRFVASGEVRGAAVAVAWRGKQVAEFYAGEARQGVPASAQTIWPLASISKVYTAAVVMALVERGIVTLSMPVSMVLPEFSQDGRENITLRHLLTHTSGLVYESPEMEERMQSQTPLDEIVDEAYTFPLQFTPGTRHAYSDYNYALAGRVASVATGTPFPELVHTLVLEPAGISETWIPSPTEIFPPLAHVEGTLAYSTAGDMYNSPYALGLAHPAFGVSATVNDLLRFGLLFAPGGERHIFSEAGIRVMTTDQTGGDVSSLTFGDQVGTAIAWGAGFSVKGRSAMSGDLLSPESFGHGGATGCTLQIDPIHDIVIAYVSNKHARTGRTPFTRRQVTVVNAAVAALTRRSGF